MHLHTLGRGLVHSQVTGARTPWHLVAVCSVAWDGAPALLLAPPQQGGRGPVGEQPHLLPAGLGAGAQTAAPPADAPGGRWRGSAPSHSSSSLTCSPGQRGRGGTGGGSGGRGSPGPSCRWRTWWRVRDSCRPGSAWGGASLHCTLVTRRIHGWPGTWSGPPGRCSRRRGSPQGCTGTARSRRSPTTRSTPAPRHPCSPARPLHPRPPPGRPSPPGGQSEHRCPV